MYQFFIEDGQVGKEYVTITGSDVNHIKNVLRMRPGEKIRVSSRSGQDFFCEIAELTDEFVQADILNEEAPSTELPSRIYLFQALPKGDRMESVIQKAVELGVYEIIPVSMRYCVVKLDEKKAARNASAKSSLRTSVKKAKLAIAEKNENTAAVVKEACIRLDKAAAKGLIPKNTAALSPMDDSPSYVEQKQLDELHLAIVQKEND